MSQVAPLRQAVRIRVVGKYLGQLLLMLAALTVVPFTVSLVFQDHQASVRYVLLIVGLLVVGGTLARLQSPVRIQKHEGIVIVALMFLLTPLLMTFPMMSAGLSFSDAVFEAVSGGTTTGLSTVANPQETSSTFLFARAWMQWYGGLGIVVLSLALIAEPGLIAKGLATTEAEEKDLIGGTKNHAKRILVIYGLLTGVGILGLVGLGLDPFHSLLYTFAALSTGGFAPHADSLGTFQGYGIPAWVIGLSLLGACPLAAYHLVWKGEMPHPLYRIQIVALLASGLFLSMLLGWTLWDGGRFAWPTVLAQAPLLTFSAQTTAGFSTVPLAELEPQSKWVLMMAMFLGGGMGSTAGGIKILRCIIFLRLVQLLIARYGLPRHAVLTPKIHRSTLSDNQIREALMLILLFGLVIGLSWFGFLLMGYDPLNSLFEVVSATTTSGLTVGITSTELPTVLKGILCLDMLMGRLEILAWLVLFNPGTWIGRRSEEP